MVEPFINIHELETILKNIESTLYLPSKFDLTETGSNVPYKISYAIVKTPLQLICGCTISNDIRLQYFEIDVVFDHLQQKSILNNKTAVDVDDFDSKHIHKIQMNFENNRDVCPLCYRTTDIKNAKIIKPLGQLYNQLEFLKTKYLGIENETFESNRKQDYDQLLQQAIKQRKRVIEKKYNTIHKIGDTGSEKNTANETKPKTLLQLFESVSLSIKEEKPDQVDKTRADTQIMNNGSNITESLHSEGNSAETNRKIIDKSEANPENAFALSVPILDTHSKGDSGDKSNSHISETLQKASNAFMTYSSALGGRKDDSSLMNVTEDDENKEINYVKCFPKYRKRTHNAVYSKLFSPKSKLFINTDISRDCTKFVLLSEHKWEVYDIIERPKTSQKGNEQPFAMKCCGRVNGDYGPSFNSLVKNNDLTKIIPDETYAFAKDNTPSMKNIHINNDGGKVRVWDHLFCKIMNNFLVIAGTKGILRIIDLDQGGKIIKTLKYRFPIRCIDVDSSRNVVACGITGKDRTNGAEQALVVFQKVSMDKDELPPPITITLPYRDPINTLQFSDDGLYLSCTTCFENRFLVISVKKIEEPRLIMKSIRNIDNSLESEGITSTNMFPGNAGLMCVTSVAYNSPPIIIETKIKSNKKMYDGRMSFSNNDTKVSGSKNQVLQPSMLLRLDELGSKIYKAEISPRNDSIVFLDKSGTIFLLASSSNNFVENNEKRRILVLDNVSNAYKLKESASIRFSKNGHKLYIVDRKGIFYIEDFAAGLPTDNFVTQCKQVN